MVGNSGETWETICAQEASEANIIGPCERALKCPQGAMKYRYWMGCLDQVFVIILKKDTKKT
jgi:hypothetical protein